MVKSDPATGRRSYSNNVLLPIKLKLHSQFKGCAFYGWGFTPKSREVLWSH